MKWVVALGLLVASGCTGRLERRGDEPPGGEDASIRLMDSGPGVDSGAGPGIDGGAGVDSGGGGTDAGMACPAGQTRCGSRCVTTATDPANCGMCGRSCAMGATCSAGTCMGGTGCEPAPAGVSADARAAYDLENEVRLAMGIPCARMDTAINLAAERHCQYYEANRGISMCVGNPHQEVMGCAMFGGANFWDRMTAAGYSGGAAAEDMHFVGNGTAAVQGWIDSVWHRTPVLSPWVRDIGYGNTGGCDTMDFGGGAPADGDLVAVYPYAGMTGVPTSFDGRYEGPNPPEPPTGWPSGYPVHIYIRGDLTEHTIVRDGTTTNIDHLWIAPGTPESLGLLRNEYTFYTHAPLAGGTRYRVHVVGSNGAGPVDLEWTFTTR